MNDWFHAIYRTFASERGPEGAYALTGGRLARSQAPETWSKRLYANNEPYIVINMIGGSIAWMFNGETIDRARIQFSVYAKFSGDATLAGRIWDGIEAIFDGVTIAPLTGTSIIMRRESLPREIIEDDVVQITGDFYVEKQV